MRIKDPKTGNWIEFPDSDIKKLEPDPELRRYYDGQREDYEHFKPKDQDILKEDIHRPPMLRAEEYLFQLAEKKKKQA